MGFELLLHELVKFHLLQILLFKLVVLVELLWVFVPQRIPRDVQVRQEPVVMLVSPDDFFVYHLNILGRHEVVDHEVLQLQLFLQDSPPLLQGLYFLSVHLLQLLVLVLQVLESLELLLDVEGLVLVLFLQGLVHFVGVVHDVLLGLKVFLYLSLFLPPLLELLELTLEVFCLLQGGFLLLVAMEYLLLHLLELFEQSLLVLFVKVLLLLFLLDLLQDPVLLLLNHVLFLVDLCLLLLELLLYRLLITPQLLLKLLHVLLLDDTHLHCPWLPSDRQRHLLPQPLDLLLKLPQQRVLRVLVDTHVVLDVLGSVRVLQTRKSLFVIVPTRPHVSDHDCLCVAPQRILQQTGQFRVSVRNVRSLGVYQSLNDQP